MMKKFMFFALASAAMLASCSSDDVIAVDEANVAQTQDGPVAIQIGLGGTAFTRGTGTVGGVTGSNNWAGEQFNLFMLKKNSMELATKNNTDAEATAVAGGDYTSAIYNNTVFDTRVGSGDVATIADDSNGEVKYYPATGTYDFWAYRLDGAQQTNVPVFSATDIKIDFTIDGSQDVLAAKTELTSADITALNNDESMAYSARAARKGVQPKLTFKHLLSRLKFKVAPGNASTADATHPVVITGIKVKSAVKGNLTIATTAGEQTIAWGTETTDSAEVSIKERLGAANVALTDLTEVPLANLFDPANTTVEDYFANDNCANVGEALLVAPDSEYKLTVLGYQTVSVGGGAPDETRNFELPLTITNGTDGFVAGTSYNVQIVVYGLEKIEVYVTLTPWDEVTLDPIGQD
jgi:hypothetical protein